MPIKSLWSSFPQMANPGSKHEPAFAEGARLEIGSRLQQLPEIPSCAVPTRSSAMPLQHTDPFSGTKGLQGPGMPRVLNTGSQPR